jgi:hypothetical protein
VSSERERVKNFFYFARIRLDEMLGKLVEYGNGDEQVKTSSMKRRMF